MFVFPNRDPAQLDRSEEEMLEAVVHEMTSELKESLVAKGVTSIEYRGYSVEGGDRVAFEFYPLGKPQIPIGEFERVLAMRFVQVLWESHGKRCLPLPAESGDDKFIPWKDGEPEYVLTREERPEPAAQALPEGLSEEDRAAKRVRRNDPCPCGSGKKYKNCCMR